jgi:hypothetical protein
MSSSHESCQSIFLNLLLTTGDHNTTTFSSYPSANYVREFLTETVSCDQFFDMSIHRNELEAHLGGRDRVARIINANEPTTTTTRDDDIIAAHALIKCGIKHGLQLANALTLSNWWIWFKSISYSAVHTSYNNRKCGFRAINAACDSLIRRRACG